MEAIRGTFCGQAQVARTLGIGEATLASWRRRGVGPRWYRIGRLIKYARTDLLEWIEAQAHGDGLKEPEAEDGLR